MKQRFRDIKWIIDNNVWLTATWLVSSLPGKFGYKLRELWWRKNLKSCGSNPVFGLLSRIQNPDKCELGQNVTIMYDSYLNASGGLIIGNNVKIGNRAKIWTDNHLFTDPDKPFMLQGFEYKSVAIGDNTEIGSCSFIKAGITIGAGCKLLPGSILYKSIPDNCIVAGNPAVIIARAGK